MSDQNRETVKRAYDAFAAGDIDGILAMLSDDVAWRVPDVLPHGGSFTGKDGALEFFGGLAEKWDGLEVSVDDIVAERDRVIVIGSAAGKLRSADADHAYPFVHAWTLRDGRATRFDEYADPPKVLTAA